MKRRSAYRKRIEQTTMVAKTSPSFVVHGDANGAVARGLVEEIRQAGHPILRGLARRYARAGCHGTGAPCHRNPSESHVKPAECVSEDVRHFHGMI